MKNKELKVGDKVYVSNRFELVSFETIIRITLTMAKSTRYTFDREIQDEFGNVRIKGQGNWSVFSGQIANKKLDEEWENQKIKHWFNKHKDHFTVEQIKKIKDLLN